MQTQKRDRQGNFKPRGGGGSSKPPPRQVVARNAFTSMFEGFRDELDKHHDRKDRIGKASRDITALSKKIIFSLQRVRNVNRSLPDDVEAETRTRLDAVAALLVEIAGEVQGLNRHRYAWQLMCVEELVEALTFAHYLRHQRLMTLDEAVGAVASLCVPAAVAAPVGAADSDAADAMECVETTTAAEQRTADDAPAAPLVVGLTEDDYLMGVFDLTGEMMRFAITSAALTGELASSPPSSAAGDPPRTVLADIQELGTLFEMLPQRKSKQYQTKLQTMRQSVLKVEVMAYGLKVRGSERPKGWMPDTSAGPDGDE